MFSPKYCFFGYFLPIFDLFSGVFCSRIFNIYFGLFAPETALLGSFSHAASGQKSLVFRTKPPLFHPIFHPQRTVRITHEKRLPAKCRSTEICAAKDHTGSCRAAAVQSNKKQKGRFSSEHQDHSKAVRRHRISVPAAPPAPRCTERCRCGRAVLHAAGSMGRVHRCALPAPQRRHPAGTGLTGHAALRHRGPPPDRKHRRTVDAGSHRCQRLRRLYPARQLRHLRHPAHRRRRGRAAALAV